MTRQTVAQMTTTATTPRTAPTIVTVWKDWLVSFRSSDAIEMKQTDFRLIIELHYRGRK